MVPSRAKPYSYFTTQPWWLKQSVGRWLFPSQHEWSRVTAALMEGDALMDAWVEHMYAHPEDRALFQQALTNGIQRVQNPPLVLKQLFEQVEKDPVWLDRTQFDLALDVLHRSGVVAQYVLRDGALMGGYLLSDFNQTLVLTGALNKGAQQRLAETSQWWMDVTTRSALAIGAKGFQSTLHVRMVHSIVRKNVPKRPEWQMGAWGLPVNQIDMYSTLYAFSGMLLMGLRVLGVPISTEESRAVMHLWKYIGWLMGVNTEWIKDSEIDSFRQFFIIKHTFSPPDWTSKELGFALSQEVLGRKIEGLQAHPKLHDWYVKLLYHVHLSNTAFFLAFNRKGLIDLGLPQFALPWFPALTVAPRWLMHSFVKYSTKKRHRMIVQGREAQERAVQEMFAKKKRGIIEVEKVRA